MPKPTRNVYSIKTTYYHGRRTLRYCEAKDEVAKFNRAADKTPLQRLSYMSCRVLRGGFQPTPARLAHRSRRASAVRKRRCKFTHFF